MEIIFDDSYVNLGINRHLEWQFRVGYEFHRFVSDGACGCSLDLQQREWNCIMDTANA